jgi:hypothetical protein
MLSWVEMIEIWRLGIFGKAFFKDIASVSDSDVLDWDGKSLPPTASVSPTQKNVAVRPADFVTYNIHNIATYTVSGP